jgi:hypothetical protein
MTAAKVESNAKAMLRLIPDERTLILSTNRNAVKQARELRNIASILSSARSWTDVEKEAFPKIIDRRIQALKRMNNGGGTTGPENCSAALDRCNNACGVSYWCHFQCRSEYMVCLAGTIFGGGGSFHPT